MSKAPDTRGRLDSQRDLNPKRKITIQKKTVTSEVKTKVSMDTFKKTVKKERQEEYGFKLSKEKKPTKGQLFKAQYGFTKTMARNLLKAELAPIAESIPVYREKYKLRRKSAAAIKKDKHMKALGGRRGKALANQKSGKK